MPYVKFKGDEEREVPDLRLFVKPNQTIEVTTDQAPGLLCQSDLWEKTTATKSAEKAEPAPEPDKEAVK